MILSRITTALKEQNWVAVTIEFLIVILGVVIGFQISAWNEARQERQDVRALLSGLVADVELAEQLAASTLDARLDRVGHLVAAWQQIEDPDVSAMGNEECLAIAASHHFGVTIANLTSLEEVLASGRLRILGSSELRMALSRYEQATDTLREMLQHYPSWATNLTRDFPALVSIQPIISASTGRVGYRGECDIAAMRNDPRFINTLTENIDLYDYFVATGLRPWREALNDVRTGLAGAPTEAEAHP
jgi:hypothetical protein